MTQDKEVIIAGLVQDLTEEKQAGECLKSYIAELEATVRERTFALEEITHQLQETQDKANIALNKEKDMNEIKTRFVSIASHEFRSPLSSIQLSASLIEHYYDRLDKDKIMTHIKKIKLCVNDLTDTLNNFLSVEKIESGKVAPIYKAFDIVHLSSAIIEELTMVAKSSQTLSYKHNGTQSLCELDGNLLKHCIVNLLSNAIKYSDENGVIELETQIHNNTCQIVVKDNGIGIPEADQRNLFKPFFRAKNTNDISGTGLGLNIVERYVNLMSGIITFESKPAIGTTFTISIPLTVNPSEI